MATKKCPKCGEENPAEAVMCWACYTPLAGGAAAVAGGGLVTPRGGAAAVTPAGTAAAIDGDEKKAIDPKIFFVVGGLLVAGLIFAFTSGVFGGGGDDIVLPPGPGDTTGGRATGGGMTSGQTRVIPPSNTGGGGTSGGGTTTGPVLPPATAAFRTVVPPNPRYANGTMAILPNTPNISPAAASEMAKYAQQMFAPGGRWTAMQVVVFNDPDAAKAFQKYQSQRKGAKLTNNEYQELANDGLWNSVPAYYETQGNSAGQSFQPSASPNNWWTGRGRR